MPRKPAIKKSSKKQVSNKKSFDNIDSNINSNADSDIDSFSYNSDNDSLNTPQDFNSDNDNLDEVDDEDKFGDDGEEIDNEDGIKIDSDNENNDKDDDDCMYRFTKKQSTQPDIYDDNISIVDDDFFDDNGDLFAEKYVSSENRITKPILFKYERVRILGERTRQLALGAKSMINNVAHINPKEVAKMELNMKVMPLIIERTLPTGQKEKWKVSELTIGN